MRKQVRPHDCCATSDHDRNGGSGNADHPFSALFGIPRGQTDTKFIQYLGKVLPAAVLGLLVIYCLRDVSIFTGNRGIPEAICIAVVAALHVWKRQMLLSIAAGTILYMILIQVVFV